MSNITIRTNDEIVKQIAFLAKAMDRPKHWVVEDALKQYIAEQVWQIEGIKQAQKSLDDGEGVSFESAIKKQRAKSIRKRSNTTW